MGFRLLDQNPVYFNNDGTVCAGGEIRVYVNLSTTPTNAGEGPDLDPSLGATITLDASGRAEDDIWIDTGPVRIRLYNADGELQWSRDYVQDGATGGLVPLDPADGTEGQVYRTDGVDPYWGDVLEVPDPTGHSGKYLGNDGETPAWTSFPAEEVYDADNLPGGLEQTATGYRVGNMLIQQGASTMAATNALTGNKAVTFATAYDSTPQVFIQLTGSGGHTPQGARVGHSVVASTTGFTVYFYAADEHDTPGWLITNTVAFDYRAEGVSAP